MFVKFPQTKLFRNLFLIICFIPGCKLSAQSDSIAHFKPAFLSTQINSLNVFEINNLSPLYIIQGENNYHLSPIKEISIGIFDLASCALGYFVVDPHRNALEVDALNKNDLPGLDQWVTTKWNEDIDKASAVPVILSGIGAGTICLMAGSNNYFFTDAVMLGEVYLTQLGINLIVKDICGRARPYAYNQDLSYEIRTDKENSVSFYSGHTSTTAAFSFFAATVFAQQSENKNAKTIVWISAATLPAITGLMRIYSGQHFTTDVLVGYAMGAAIGYFIPKLHQTQNGMSLIPFFNNENIGMGFSMRF
jgi:membrane-associated phospholipid phosphatase